MDSRERGYKEIIGVKWNRPLWSCQRISLIREVRKCRSKRKKSNRIN